MGTNTETVRDRKKTRKLAAEIAQMAVDAVPLETDPELEVNFQPAEEGDEIESGDPTDVFEAAKTIIAKHDFAKFTIKKNGEYIATKPFPYSIEQLQKEYGAGSYLIYLKNGTNGRIVKQQTIQIADAPAVDNKTMPQFAFDGNNGMGMEAGSKQPSFMEFFLLKNDLEEKNRIRQQEVEAKFESRQREIEARLKEADRAKESSSSDMFKMMLTMQQENSKQLQALMLESQKTQMGLMTTLMTKMAEKPKDDTLKAHELAKMLGDAEKNGYARWKDISEMIDKKAEAKAEEMAESKGDGDESLTKTLIKGFMPLISQAVTSGALAAPAQPTPQQIEQINLERRRAEHQRVQLENKKLAQRQEAERRKSMEAQRPVAPVAKPATPAATGPSEVNDLPQPPRETMNGKFKDHIQSLVLPVLAEDYSSGITGPESATRCLALLAKERISRKDVLDNFRLEDIIGLVEQFSLPKQTIPWFKDFYTTIERGVASNANLERPTRNAPGQFAEDSAGNTP